MILNEDRAAVVRSFRALTQLDFEAAVFGHGTPITTGAAERFLQAAHLWERSGSSSGLIGAPSTNEPESEA